MLQVRRPTCIASTLQRFKRCADGVAAIEFAFIFPPFLMLLCGILGISLYYLAETNLEASLALASRQIRTGENQSTLTVGSLKQQICDGSTGLIKCSDLAIIIQNKASWAEFQTTPSCTDENGNIAASSYPDTYPILAASGGAKRAVIIVACYPWKLLASIPYLGMKNVNNGSAQLVQAVTAFKSEAY